MKKKGKYEGNTEQSRCLFGKHVFHLLEMLLWSDKTTIKCYT